jgi:hypothetical protein
MARVRVGPVSSEAVASTDNIAMVTDTTDPSRADTAGYVDAIASNPRSASERWIVVTEEPFLPVDAGGRVAPPSSLFPATTRCSRT